MATITDITTGVQTVTAAGAVTGTLDISGLSGDFTVKIRVTELSAEKTAVIALEDSVNAFTAAVQQAVVQVRGAVKPEAEKVFSFKKADLPAFRLGTASGVCRINVLSVTATPGLKVHAWLEQ
jgi:hypothetical protein